MWQGPRGPAISSSTGKAIANSTPARRLDGQLLQVSSQVPVGGGTAQPFRSPGRDFSGPPIFNPDGSNRSDSFNQFDCRADNAYSA
jgi:hypothetical protein